MASIRKELDIDVDVAKAWALLRPVGDAHLAFKPVLSSARLDRDIRTATFLNGMVLHEQILDVDDSHRRLAYAATDAPGLTYHHATMEVTERGSDKCRFVWITDFIPAEASSALAPLIDAGASAFKTNLEGR